MEWSAQRQGLALGLPRPLPPFGSQAATGTPGSSEEEHLCWGAKERRGEALCIWELSGKWLFVRWLDFFPPQNVAELGGSC